jgi:bifunctional non-homologous end joining protein LigD
VIGYTLSESPNRPFASLLLVTRDGGHRLRHVGRVGTGWDEREMVRLAKLLLPLRTDTAPVERVLPGQVRREIRWVKPQLVAQVGYAEVTRDGALRHPRYLGLREDKPAPEVRLERPAKPPRAAPRRRTRASLR